MIKRTAVSALRAPQNFRRLPASSPVTLSRPARPRPRRRPARLPAQYSLFASCSPGLEAPLSSELLRLLDGTSESRAPVPAPGGVSFGGSLHSAVSSHLWLGCASRVLLRLPRGRITFSSPKHLEKAVAALPWDDWILPDLRVAVGASVRGRSDEDGERHLSYAVRRGIKKSLGDRPAGAETVSVLARIEGSVVELSVPSSGSPLHRRGYRLASGKAPLREDIAHAMLICGGWKSRLPDAMEKSDGRFPHLLDPFCGSGTIVIEGARMAAGIPPGIDLPLPFVGTAWEAETAAIWDDLVGKARQHSAKIIAGGNLPSMIGSDRDAGAVAAAGKNAQRAGVGKFATFEEMSVSGASSKSSANGDRGLLVVTNPPHGVRISPSRNGGSRGQHLLPLYQTLGHRVGKVEGAQVAMLARGRDGIRLARRTGLEGLKVRLTTSHGGSSVSVLANVEG
eukprot:CAMPEP_0194274592 /NCGR_PEP_ID=MMETSP0169-20130528/7638_1 /TAXON_ID=218684 /ORGANISM="Corethron pennatum, Strain L29A3" /LENGTH=451 /DNA_ID=CAMNT_0039017827 /DNA_START=1 /DNA_END=1356 /DNA_ORIENTATION=-